MTVLAQDDILHKPDLLLSDSPGAFFAISVADIDNIVNWYRDSLGFSVYSRSENPERAMKFALLKYENAIIEVLEQPMLNQKVQ